MHAEIPTDYEDSSRRGGLDSYFVQFTALVDMGLASHFASPKTSSYQCYRDLDLNIWFTQTKFIRDWQLTLKFSYTKL